jgi:hypothetical protein
MNCGSIASAETARWRRGQKPKRCPTWGSTTLTATSFWVADAPLLWALGVLLGFAVLAIARMGVHLGFFLSITTGPDSTNNVHARAWHSHRGPRGVRLDFHHGEP